VHSSRSYLLAAPHPFFSPAGDQFLVPDPSPAVRALLEMLGVRALADADVFVLFLLPAFATLPAAQQRRQRAHLLSHWPELREHDGLHAALCDTAFVPVGGRLLRPAEVLDPRVGTPGTFT
jgi:hypothetical protein